VKNLKLLIAMVVLSLALNGCYINDYKNIDGIQIEGISPSFAFPLINSSVSINELLQAVDSSAFVEIRNDSIFIKFSQEMDFDLDLNTFKIPDTDFSGTIPIIAGAAFDIQEPDFVTIENDSEIKSVNLKAGNLQVGFERDFIDPDMTFRLVLYSLVNEQNPDSIVLTPDWSGDPFRSNVYFNLAGAELKLTKVDPVSGDMLYNTFSYAIDVKSSGNSSGEFTTNIAFSGVEFERVTGLINFELDMPVQEMDLSAFSSIVDGKLYLKNPSIGFRIGTSFGVPSSIELSEMKFENSAGEVLQLQNEGAIQDNTFLVGVGLKNYLPYATLGEPYVVQEYILSGENSNLDEILPFAPSKISLATKFSLGDAETMPADPHSFFVNDTSSFDLGLDIEVPLAGSIEGLKFSYDLYGMTFPEIDSIPMLKDFDFSIALLMKTTNSIPLTFGLQVVFFEQGEVVDSLFNNVLVENIIVSPNIDNQGNPIEPSDKFTTIEITKEKYERISKSDKLQLVLHLDSGTEEQREVVFKASHELGVQLSLRFDVEVEPDL
jgi:hypothetical protein